VTKRLGPGKVSALNHRVGEAKEDLKLEHVIDSLRELRLAYKRYFKNPSPNRPERWRHCEACFDRALAALKDREVAVRLNPLMSAAIKDGHASTPMAASNASSFEPRIDRLERRVGSSLGYSEAELTDFFTTARGTLSSANDRHTPLAAPRSSDELVEQLLQAHAQVVSVFHAPRGRRWSRRDRRRDRGQVRKNVQRELYAIGALVANGLHAEEFHYSLALSLGVRGAEASRRQRITRVVERLADAA
jgi:hypothetical protein